MSGWTLRSTHAVHSPSLIPLAATRRTVASTSGFEAARRSSFSKEVQQRGKTDAFVAIEKRMVLDKAEGQRRADTGCGRLGVIVHSIDRPEDSGLQQPSIAKTVRPTESSMRDR